MGRQLGTFETIVLLGSNLRLLGGHARARWLLRRFHAITGARSLIVAESRDPYATTDPAHLAYHERNRRRGHMGGQLRLRVRYKQSASPWFDYLFVSPAELEEILNVTGWQVRRYIPGEGGLSITVLGKAGRPA